MNKSTIEDLCRMGLITKTGLIGSKLAEDLQARELFTKSFITMTGLISNVDTPEPVLEEVDPEDTEAVAQAQAKYEAAIAAYNTAIESSLINVIERRKQFSDVAASGICDWNEMDPDSPAYIRNRTHYKFIDTPKTTTVTIGTPESYICPAGDISSEEIVIVRLFYASGLSEEVPIYEGDANSGDVVNVHVSGQSLIVAELHFNATDKSLVSYKYQVVPIFVSEIYEGPDSIYEFMDSGWTGNVVCVATSTVKTADDLNNYIAKELGYNDKSDMQQSWMDECSVDGKPNQEKIAAFDNTRITRFKEIQNQFLFPKIFGGTLIIRPAFLQDYQDIYLPAVENNDVPTQESFSNGEHYLSVDLKNPSETYIKYFNLKPNEDQEYFIYLLDWAYTGSEIVGGKANCVDIPLFPTEDNYYDKDSDQCVIPENFEDNLFSATLSSLGSQSLGEFSSTVDNSELKQLDIKFMPVGTAVLVSQWKSFVQNSGSTQEPMLG